MKRDEALRLQALVDGELTGREAAAAAALARTGGAARLADELRGLAAELRACPPERPLPETREFFWGKVRRGIEAAGRAPAAAAPAPGRPAWLRWLLPAAAAAALAALFLARPTAGTGEAGDGLVDQELVSLSENMRTLTFHSQSDGLTIVWVQHTQLD
jgi:hypothetical protein